jgi:hypothetical protein
VIFIDHTPRDIKKKKIHWRIWDIEKDIGDIGKKKIRAITGYGRYS